MAGERQPWVGVRGWGTERADQMSNPPWVFSCQLTYSDLPGMPAPKPVCLILLLEQILEKSSKTLVTYKYRKHLAFPQGRRLGGIHT